MILVSASLAGCGGNQATLRPIKLSLSPDPVEQMILPGPPETRALRSGRVVLKPTEAMHRHSTERNEELLVFLKGHGQVVLGTEAVAVNAGDVLYIPPHTEHEVHNDGPEKLRYIFTVAPAER
jgi:mannose-6-phosphate isomerase-like protein (cupin superfamily)